MTYCVIGNSHVGMLRAAARNGAGDGPSLVYFAKAGSGLEKATIRGSVIAALDPGLAAAQSKLGMPGTIDVATCGAVIFVGGAVSVFNAAQMLQTHRVWGWPVPAGCAAPASDRGSRDDRQLISEAAFVDGLADRARRGYSHRFARALRQASDVPMFLVPQPFPSEAALDSAPPHGPGFRRLRDSGEGAALVSPLASALDQAFAEIEGIRVLHQPGDTVAYGFLTARAFSRDAVRVNGDTPQHGGDILHVGPAFGARVLDRVKAALQG